MVKRTDANAKEKKIDFAVILPLFAVLLFVISHIYLYYQTLSSLRLVVSRLIYSASILSIGTVILFIMQYSLLFVNFRHIARLIRWEDLEDRHEVVRKIVANISLFLFLNFASEIVILRMG